MKRTKFSLAALASIAFSVFSSPSFAASDADLNPYLLAVAKTHLAPYMSRDLGKEVKFSTDPYEKRQAKLNVSIPNATCEDYRFLRGILGAELYALEFAVDRLEEDKNLTMDELEEPMSTYMLLNVASSVILSGIWTNPEINISCEFEFKQMDKKDHPFHKRVSNYLDQVLPRYLALREEGRIKEPRVFQNRKNK